jgi:hypothetical protein
MDPMRFLAKKKDLRRKNSAGLDGKGIAARMNVNLAIKHIFQGAERPELLRACWRYAEDAGRDYLKFEDMDQFLGTFMRFKLLTENKASTGILNAVGHYLDGFPKKLIKNYEDWYKECEDTTPEAIPIIVLKLPNLKCQMGVLREGALGTDTAGSSGIVYVSEEASYVLQSCRAFGAEIAGYLNQ